MRAILLLLVLVLGVSCAPNTQKEPTIDYFEVYTTSTIYYVDCIQLRITSENDVIDQKFATAKEMLLFLERQTGDDASDTYDEMDHLDAEIDMLRKKISQCQQYD